MLKSFSLLIEIDVEIKVRTTRRQALISVFKDTTPLKQFLTDYVVDIFARLILLFLDDNKRLLQFSSVAQSCPTLHTPWTTAYQASLSIINSQCLLKHVSIESVMPSNHQLPHTHCQINDDGWKKQHSRLQQAGQNGSQMNTCTIWDSAWEQERILGGSEHL